MPEKFPDKLYVSADDLDDDVDDQEYFNTARTAETLLSATTTEIAVYQLVGIKKGKLTAVFSE
jgi:hypothetical protein